MRLFLFSLLFCLGTLVMGNDSTKVVTITFHGVKEAKGKIQYSLISEQDKDIFPRPGKKENGSFQDRIDVKNKDKVMVKVTLPVDRKFAISAYHDLDGNGAFKLLMYVIPKEPYGFSKIKEPPLGEPEFSECSFDPSKTDKVDVYLK